MGGGCSCFAKSSKKRAEIRDQGWELSENEATAAQSTSENSLTSVRKAAEVKKPPVVETQLVDVVVVEDGELIKTKKWVAQGAAANLAALLVEAHDLAKRAVHSMQSCFALVYKLCTLQQSIWNNKQLVGDGIFMLEVQELAMEVIQLNKLFSCRGWLARLNQSDVDDDLEFHRLLECTTSLQEKCGAELMPSSLAKEFRPSDWTPSSSQLMRHLKLVGGLHTLSERQRSDLRDFVSRLAPLLSVKSSAVASLVEQEIKVAAASELPGAHSAVRHSDLRLMWWEHLQVEEVTWEEFWKVFPEELLVDSSASDCVGNPQAVAELVGSAKNRQAFETGVKRGGYSDYVTTVEIDHVFTPNRTVEDCIRQVVSAILERPRSIEGSEELWNSTHSAQQEGGGEPSSGKWNDKDRVIRDIAGIPGEGTEMVGRGDDISRLCTMVEEGRRLVAVVGPSGMGKSAVAATVADVLLHCKFWRFAYHIDLSQVDSIDDAAGRISAALGIPLYQNSVTNVPRFMNWIKRYGPDHQRTGWVLDGIDALVQQSTTRASLFTLLTQAMRHSPNLQFLLTCRCFPDLTENARLEEVVRLKSLSEDESIGIGQGLLGGAISHGEAIYLAAASAGYPLGVKLSGGCVVAGGCTAVEMLGRVREGALEGPSGSSSPAFPRGGKAPVHDVISQCLDLLSVEDQKALFLLLECSTQFSVEHAAAVLDKVQQPTQVWSFLWRLMLRGFLRFMPADGMYRMEDGVADFLRLHYGEEEDLQGPSSRQRKLPVQSPPVDHEAAQAGLIRYHVRLMDRVLDVHRSGAQLSAMRLLEQERAGLEKFVLCLAKETVVWKAVPRGSINRFLAFVETLCEFLTEVGIHFFSPVQQAAVVDAAFQLTEHTKPSQKREAWYNAQLALAKALITVGNGGEAEGVLDRIESQIAESQRAQEGADSDVMAECLVCRARIRHKSGRFREAEQLYLQGLRIQREACGPESFAVSKTLSDLATAQQVEPPCLFSTAVLMQTPSELDQLGDELLHASLGNKMSLQKNPAAEKAYKMSLRIRRKHHDRNVVAVATVMHNLASVNHQMGQHGEAERLYLKCLNMREKYLGHVNMEVASSLGSLAAVKVSKEEYAEAEVLYRSAILMLKEILGDDHLAVADMCTRLAVLLESSGADEAAGQLYVDALEVKEKVLGSFHEQVVKMVQRIQRVMAKTAQGAAHGTAMAAEGLAEGLSEGISQWRQYFAQLMSKHTSPIWGRTSEAETDFMSAVSYETTTATDLFMTAQSMSTSIFYDSPRNSTTAPVQNSPRGSERPGSSNRAMPMRSTSSEASMNAAASSLSALSARGSKAPDRYKLPPSPLHFRHIKSTHGSSSMSSGTAGPSGLRPMEVLKDEMFVGLTDDENDMDQDAGVLEAVEKLETAKKRPGSEGLSVPSSPTLLTLPPTPPPAEVEPVVHSPDSKSSKEFSLLDSGSPGYVQRVSVDEAMMAGPSTLDAAGGPAHHPVEGIFESGDMSPADPPHLDSMPGDESLDGHRGARAEGVAIQGDEQVTGTGNEVEYVSESDVNVVVLPTFATSGGCPETPRVQIGGGWGGQSSEMQRWGSASCAEEGSQFVRKGPRFGSGGGLSGGDSSASFSALNDASPNKYGRGHVVSNSVSSPGNWVDWDKGSAKQPVGQAQSEEKASGSARWTPNMYDNRAFLSLTLEDDLMESTALAPEHFHALHSIANPLFRQEAEVHTDSPSSSAPIITTHASFDL